MPEREVLVEKLVTEMHLSVPERARNGDGPFSFCRRCKLIKATLSA
jgi:hypothetical protein